MNIGNDLLLLLTWELPDLINDFVCAHTANLSMFSIMGKLCGGTTSLPMDYSHANFGVSFGAGPDGFAGVSSSGW